MPIACAGSVNANSAVMEALMQHQDPSGELAFIDISTPETLERDFYAWLNGDLNSLNRRRESANSNCFENVEREAINELPTLPTIEHFISSKNAFTSSSRLLSRRSVTVSYESDPEDVAVLLSKRSIPIKFDDEQPSSILSSISYREDYASYDERSLTPSSSTLSVIGGCYSGNSPQSSTSIASLATSPSSGENTGNPFTTTASRATSRSSGTNQLGRIYSPGLPLGMSEREQIVELYQRGWKICDISKSLCITHSCVSKILHRFRTTGSVKPKDAKEGRQELPLVAAIRDYRNRLGICRQSDIREQLILDGICRRDNAPSRSSINHILRTKLNLKRRKKP